MDQDEKKYEISLVLRSGQDQGAVGEALKKGGASVLQESPIARFKLAYPIKKEIFGWGSRLLVSSPPENIQEIGRDLRANPQILRLFIIRTRVGESPLESDEEKERRVSRFAEEVAIRSAAPSREKEREPSIASSDNFRGELTNEALEKKLEELLK